jgi:hypothetical protein
MLYYNASIILVKKRGTPGYSQAILDHNDPHSPALDNRTKKSLADIAI